ncbi:MAG: hypothetical protein IJZ68_02270 [Bacteroidaceae bacterium]|nr:hypothetical protein [Bacteroidaceae bacterium]
MKLTDNLPYELHTLGKTWRLNPAWYRVLRALDFLADERLYPQVREEAALRLLLRSPLPHKNTHRQLLLKESMKLLVGESKGESGAQAISLTQDAALIRTAFLQAYGIDLNADRTLHWWTFREMLANLPADTRMAEVISIRTRTLPPPNKYNAAARRALQEAKARCAIQLTEQERKQNYQHSAVQMANAMLSIAQKKVTK